MSARAKPSVLARKSDPGTLGMLMVIILLLALPASALSRCALWIDWRVLIATPGVASLFSYFAYRADKRRAERGDWRIPEVTLHLAELLGGWPGAFLAQRKYRHKTAKLSFQLIFWSIVLLHELVALDFLLEWRLSKSVLQLIRTQIG